MNNFIVSGLEYELHLTAEYVKFYQNGSVVKEISLKSPFLFKSKLCSNLYEGYLCFQDCPEEEFYFLFDKKSESAVIKVRDHIHQQSSNFRNSKVAA